jgi:hypothetical protein
MNRPRIADRRSLIRSRRSLNFPLGSPHIGFHLIYLECPRSHVSRARQRGSSPTHRALTLSHQPGSSPCHLTSPARTQPEARSYPHPMKTIGPSHRVETRNRPRLRRNPKGKSLMLDQDHRGTVTPRSTTTPATTLAKVARDCRDLFSPTTAGASWTSAGRSLSVAVTTTLSAELEGRLPCCLVDDIVRSVVDETRHTDPDRGDESTIREARRRLERFVLARSGR